MLKIVEQIWYISAVVYAKYYTFVKRRFGIERQKLRFFLVNVRRPRIIKVSGLFFQMNPDVTTSFARMIGGTFNEDETHLLLHRIIDRAGTIDLFVDIGSNIGEFIIDLAATNKVTRVVGFEPNPACVKSCAASISLNHLRNVDIVQKVLMDKSQRVLFDLSGDNAHLHSIFDGPTPGSQKVKSSTLDNELKARNKRVIVLIDVEGAETLVLKGGKNFVARNFPIIIFEFNHRSRLHFSLEDIRLCLPRGYELFRLRHDGYIDSNLTETANCVTLHKNSPLFGATDGLIQTSQK